MIAKQDNGFYIIKLETGEDIETTLFQFCQEHSIFSGYIHGIGAVSSVDIAIYNIEKRAYITKKYSGDLEIVNLFGTISKPKIHIHMTVADQDNSIFGGHLMKSEISVTGEIILVPGNSDIPRKMDDSVGLPLMDLG